MHRASSPMVRLSILLVLAVLLCTGPAGAALSDHPVITGISGPGSIRFDENGAPTGSYKYTAYVTCGSPPYTYKWMNPAGFKTLQEGVGLDTVTIPVDQLALSGGNRWAVWLTVTDSEGRDALWMRNTGAGNSNEFLYYLETDYTTQSWKKITEPATFSAAPSSCPSASGGSGSSSGGSGDSGGGGDLPLVPIAALAAILAAAGLVGAKALGAKAATGAGSAAGGSTPGTTRTWTDDRGMERTATLQPDGTWTSDTGSTVDLDKAADARQQHQDDLKRSREDQAGQVSSDKGQLDGFDKNLDALKKERSQELKDFQKSLRDHAEAQRDLNEKMAGVYNTQGNIMNGYVAAGGALDKAGDISVNVLAKVAPQIGVPLKEINTAAKSFGKNISSSYNKGESLWKGAGRGALEYGFNKIFDGVKDKAKAATGGKVPGLYDIKGDTWSDGIKNAAQTEGVNMIAKDPLKTAGKTLSNSTLGKTIGKF
jgi:hypothetical protein